MTEAAPRDLEELPVSLRRLSDDELVARLKGLGARERRATAVLVAHLAEMDTRDVHLRAGYSSLFAYCCGALALSEHEALNRIEAARTARRFPVVLDLLAAGEVTLTTVRLLGPHLTNENHVAVLESARGKKKAAVEEIVARLSPRADVSVSLRKLSQARGAAPGLGDVATPGPMRAGGEGAVGDVPACLVGGVAGSPAESSGNSGSSAAPRLVRGVERLVGTMDSRVDAVSVSWGQPARSAEIEPLSPDRYRYQLTIGTATLEKLRLAKDMLRHALPSGDDAAILDRALTELLKDLARSKFGGERAAGAETLSRESGPAAAADDAVSAKDSRHIPVEVKRAVWVRDLGRCAFVGTDGHRCGERAFLQFHHVRPYAAGGEPTVDNIQLRCARHNQHEARVFFARGEVDEGRIPTDNTREAAVTHRVSRGRSGTSRSTTTTIPAGRSGQQPVSATS